MKVNAKSRDFVSDIVNSKDIFDKRLLKLYSLTRSIKDSKESKDSKVEAVKKASCFVPELVEETSQIKLQITDQSEK